MSEPATLIEALRPTVQPAVLVPQAVHYAVEQFLYLEAALLDEWRFREWLALMADDIHYVLTTNTQAQTRDRRRGVAPPLTYIFNEDKFQLERRVARLETGMAWAEEPPSRTRHFVSNLRVLSDDGRSVETSCNYLIHRASKAHDIYTFVGTRRDVLRRTDTGPGWEVASRELALDEFVLQAPNLSILF
ncbi:3-phenylpropionate/cinnamic acid dioxygenase subunit beta [Ideonella sp. B7]|uniref:3-phenylpropionate/cinnamic acid dioxygenase subunit beta n=1 Tax=Ideonella benzenivorans TaxID=2831643 RepID=UPI001CECBD6D|nr:3-phenylpropionate/cinnamic acid dioxygenase subunit beta [Ideonella benzenivorans]MCA6215340.1 3-phenylpropionate/cinnamic acid dioxygenase subunit beta [Ideonella benzenivorans]